jgi:hypothetical protein
VKTVRPFFFTSSFRGPKNISGRIFESGDRRSVPAHDPVSVCLESSARYYRQSGSDRNARRACDFLSLAVFDHIAN